MHLALPMRGLAIGQHPDIGGDAGVVKHVERQGDNGLQIIVFDDPAADIALALPGVAGEQGTAVVDLGNAAAERGVALHLGQHVDEEQHLPIAGAGEQGIVRIAVVRDDEARISYAALAAQAVEVVLPALAVGRIAEHKIELAGRESVVGEGRMFRAADDVVRRATLALEQQVGFANRVGLGVDLLPVEMRGDSLAAFSGEFLQGFLGHGQHAAGSERAVVEQVGA